MYQNALCAFGDATVLVIGDIMLDKYTYGTVERISPEGPIPIVKVTKEEYIPGGSANVASNIASLGGRALMCGIIGKDRDGDILCQEMQNRGIDTEGVLRIDNVTTIRKSRVIAQHQQLMRVDFEDKAAQYDHKELIEKAKSLAASADIIILSDYAKGIITKELCMMLSDLINQGKTVLIDPKPQNTHLYPHSALLTPNRKEAYGMSGCDALASIDEVASTLVKNTNCDILMTLSEKGMLFTPKNGKATHVPTVARDVFDVTGAGDTVIATLAMGLAVQLPTIEAMNLANHAAGIAVAQVGCAAITASQLSSAFKTDDSKIKTRPQLANIIAELQQKGHTVATLNGCFDIIHPGHIFILNQAKAQADYLVVALNTDQSIKRSKGSDRPINNLHSRSAVMAAMGMVDFITEFDEETPVELLRELRPNVHINDATYGQDCVEAPVMRELNGRLHLIDKHNCPSTTDTISKIKKL